MSTTPVVADFAAESKPAYEAGNMENYYIKGYDPVSLGAPHSSLLKAITWVGMGLFMAALAGYGTALYGFAQMYVGTGTVDHNPAAFAWGGLIGGVIVSIISVICISVGRKDYKAYVKRTGRMD